MAKAYDRVQWPFLLGILRRMGFSEKWIRLIERSVNSCWFSVVINGSQAGFFKSTRGLRQGDPLSPSLFVLAADYLSRLLDKRLLDNKELKYKTARYGFGVSHLAYADDVIVFTQASIHAVQQVKSCLQHYADVSGQKINTDKSNFFIHERFASLAEDISRTSGFQKGSFPFGYLGAPIYKGQKKSDLFTFLREKISSKIHTWSHRQLSFGGRLTLIRSVLAAIPIHIFQVMEPTKEALKSLEQLIARFFWGSTNDKKKTHWMSWARCCMPFDEGGLGLRRFQDMVAAFSAKIWWRFREGSSLWAKYMHAKYCSYSSPLATSLSSRNSPIWRRMARAGISYNGLIRWAVGDGKISFWDDTWLGDRPLKDFCRDGSDINFRRARDFWQDNGWDEGKLSRNMTEWGVPDDIIAAICNTPYDRDGKDAPRWTLTRHGDFTVSSAWEFSRARQPKYPLYGHIWNKNLTPSMSIFLWRLLANRIPVDEKLQWRNISLASKCRCCKKPSTESVRHLFIQGDTAQAVWRHFARWFPSRKRPSVRNGHIEGCFGTWWVDYPRATKRHISFTIPCVILWSLWSERNNCIHRESELRASQVIWLIDMHLRHLVLSNILLPEHWRGCTPQAGYMIRRERRMGTIRVRMVRWCPPDLPWFKVNTDGAYDAATGEAGGGGIIRDEQGRTLRAFCTPLRASSSLEAELLAMYEGVSVAADLGRPIWIEVDATEVIRVVRDGWHGPADIRHHVTKLRRLLRRVTFKITHTDREGNRVADTLAKQGLTETALSLFDRLSLPPQARAMADLDEQGLPSFRFYPDAVP